MMKVSFEIEVETITAHYRVGDEDYWMARVVTNPSWFATSYVSERDAIDKLIERIKYIPVAELKKEDA